MYAICYTDPAINNGYNTQVIYVRDYTAVRRIRRRLDKLGITCTTEYCVNLPFRWRIGGKEKP